jgi:hypothetical protein
MDGARSGGYCGLMAATGTGQVALRVGAEEEGAHGPRSVSVSRPKGIVSFVNYSKIFK